MQGSSCSSTSRDWLISSLNQKILHSYMRERKKGCPSVRGSDDNLVSDSVGMSEIFVEAFSLVYVSKVSIEPHHYQEFHGLMEDLQFTCKEVFG